MTRKWKLKSSQHGRGENVEEEHTFASARLPLQVPPTHLRSLSMTQGGRPLLINTREE